MRSPSRLAADRAGSAAAELALALPLLLILMFGSFEVGYYFLSEHVVQKSVRDAARYASRLPMTSYPGCAPSATALTQIQRVAKAGDPDGDADGDGTQDKRLEGWTADTMTTVRVTCDTSGTYTGIYSELAQGVPVVTVIAQVPYNSLFGALGIVDPSLVLNAQSQSAVFGA
ncbi:TadE/TadG family type IV pilus assembly protein [Sphingomonas sp.]|uniref:TadE/TadG family type IV pilus assembly protein n=1 Tax=Sphingomonas sp. TaxID=28214 RepID=UPI001805D0A4|nr:TadE/TadG family type IV pilus assembly protein [Sphingomonas sp.]MBA3511797.1 pilus assembly protein [Sphingomonas sp.]